MVPLVSGRQIMPISTDMLIVALDPRLSHSTSPGTTQSANITATTEDGNSQTVNCELHHHPFMASWRPIWRIIRALIVLGIIGGAIYYVLRLGGGWRLLYNSPQTWVDQLIRTVEGWFFR